MTEYRDWSVTASANTGAAANGFFQENMKYEDVNNAAREFQAILARDRADKNGTIYSTGESGSYNLAVNTSLDGYRKGDSFVFRAHAKNVGATTLKVSTLSSLAVVNTNLSALAEDQIAAGGVYACIYVSASANSRQFQLLNPSRILSNIEISSGAGLTGGGTIDASRTLAVGAGTGITVNANDIQTNDGAIDHDALSNFVADEHVAHSGVTLTAGNGLTGGGTIAASRSFAVGAGTGITVNANDVQTNDGQIVHDNLSGFVADEHVAHSSVTLTAGNGLTGGGTIAANRTFNVGAGTGISVAADSVSTNDAQIDHDALSNFVANEHRLITVSTSSASGGANGDVWLEYTP